MGLYDTPDPIQRKERVHRIEKRGGCTGFIMTTQFFDLTPYARLRSYNEGQRLEMRAEPLTLTGEGYTLGSAGKNEWQLGFEWDEPRQVTGVELHLAPGSPCPTSWRVEYWRFAWPRQPSPYRLGASAGWFPTDDHYHGVWREAQGERTGRDGTLSMRFDPMDIVELESRDPKAVERFFQSEDLNAPFRQAVKLRLVFEGDAQPQITRVRWVGRAEPEEAACRVFARAAGGQGPAGGRIALWNGRLLSEGVFAAGEAALIRYIRNPANTWNGDRTLLQLELPPPYQSFSVAAEDIDRGVYLPDYDLLLVPEGWTEPPQAIIQRLTKGRQSVYDGVAVHEEQTLSRAFEAIPEMDVVKQTPYGRFVILGWEGVRQKFCLRYNGDIFADKLRQKVCKRDCAKLRWAGGCLHFRLGSGDPVSFGEERGQRRQFMPEAAVPVYVTQWLDRGIEYTQTSFAVPMDIPQGYALGSEDLIVLSRVRLRNATGTRRRAVLAVNLHPQEALQVENGRLLATGRVQLEDSAELGWKVRPYPRPLLRAVAAHGGRGALRCVPGGSGGLVSGQLFNSDFHDFYDGHHNRYEASGTIENTLLYDVELAPGEAAEVDLKIPYPTYEEEADFRRVEAFDFDAQRGRVEAFWRAFASRGASIRLPEDPRLNDFVRAVPWHILMTASRDVETGFYVVPAGTYLYGACGNEACMQINLLDMLGYHEIAERYLDAFIDSQGAGSMDGCFSGYEGALVVNDYANPKGDPEMMFAYNLDHGYILQCFAQHYRITGNIEWLRRAANTLVAGCDFVIRERAATRRAGEDGKPVSYYGLMPHGRLEDNAEWRCWVAVNAHACAGLWACARVLEDIGHPEAKRLGAEALSYREDILSAVRRAVAQSPAVPDGRGGYMPHVPTRMELRGRDWGWFREAAYGPLHLAQEGVLPANDPLITWVLRDLEDNLFLSRDWGRNIDRERHWFDQGGIAVQSNLLFNDQAYLERGQPEYAVRALFNNFAQNLYRDMNCFSEHPIPEFGFGFGPFFKTSDEAQFLVNLRYHLLREEDAALHLLQGAAREWLEGGKSIHFDGLPTAFGPVSLALEMDETAGRARAYLRGRWRRRPLVVLHLRHGEGRPILRASLDEKPLPAPEPECLRFEAKEGEMILDIAFAQAPAHKK